MIQRYYVFKDDKILFPFPDNLYGLQISVKYDLGSNCYAVEIEEEPEGKEFRQLRSLLGQLDDPTFALVGRAYQLLNWDKRSQFCGRCGAKTEQNQKEILKSCPACGNVIYPRISPAIIVAIIKGDQILLAHAAHFQANWYSIIAGFVEPGETFEQAVHREVAEEVGIKVKKLRYFGSQPWPFPDTLMVGFTAEYESGEIRVDGAEITSAGWYSRDNLPDIPSKGSIAGRIIAWFCETL